MNRLTSTDLRRWTARILISLVLIINLQCAVLFIWKPGGFAPGFELHGTAGEAAVRGIGILFLMWNVPYTVALIDPAKHRISLYEAIAMQTLGLVGETLLLSGLPEGHPTLQASVTRFVVFDASGLAALLLAAWVTRRTSD